MDSKCNPERLSLVMSRISPKTSNPKSCNFRSSNLPSSKRNGIQRSSSKSQNSALLSVQNFCRPKEKRRIPINHRSFTPQSVHTCSLVQNDKSINFKKKFNLSILAHKHRYKRCVSPRSNPTKSSKISRFYGGRKSVLFQSPSVRPSDCSKGFYL